MADPEHYSTTLSDRGRLVLPARLRKRLNLQPGDRLIITVDDTGGFRAVSASELARSLRGLFRDLAPGRSLADELIAERRKEAEREDAALTNDVFGSVLDASALLAYLQDEAGSQAVEAALTTGAVINVVNYAEVLSRLADAGDEPESVHRRLRHQGLVGDLLMVVPLDEVDGITIARLRIPTRGQGLSLGDRACLATALRLGRTAITADRSWSAVDAGVTVRLIRS